MFDLYLFDLDDTLLDFQKSQIISFENIFLEFGVKNSIDRFFLKYKELSHKLWMDFENNKLKKEVLLTKRFEDLFNYYKISLDPIVFGALYLEELTKHNFLVPNAEKVLSEIKLKKSFVTIITNGMKHVQEKRILNSGLDKYIDHMVVSEDCGYAKPHLKIFETAINKTSSNLDKTIVIGDKLEADILGGINAGIKTCWYNPNNHKINSNIKPDLEIKCLKELLELSC